MNVSKQGHTVYRLLHPIASAGSAPVFLISELFINLYFCIQDPVLNQAWPEWNDDYILKSKYALKILVSM